MLTMLTDTTLMAMESALDSIDELTVRFMETRGGAPVFKINATRDHEWWMICLRECRKESLQCRLGLVAAAAVGGSCRRRRRHHRRSVAARESKQQCQEQLDAFLLACACHKLGIPDIRSTQRDGSMGVTTWP